MIANPFGVQKTTKMCCRFTIFFHEISYLILYGMDNSIPLPLSNNSCISISIQYNV